MRSGKKNKKKKRFCWLLGHCLAIKVFISKLPAMGRGGSSHGRPIMKGTWANEIVITLNWGAFDHASHAPQIKV